VGGADGHPGAAGGAGGAPPGPGAAAPPEAVVPLARADVSARDPPPLPGATRQGPGEEGALAPPQESAPQRSPQQGNNATHFKPTNFVMIFFCVGTISPKGIAQFWSHKMAPPSGEIHWPPPCRTNWTKPLGLIVLLMYLDRSRAL